MQNPPVALFFKKPLNATKLHHQVLKTDTILSDLRPSASASFGWPPYVDHGDTAQHWVRLTGKQTDLSIADAVQGGGSSPQARVQVDPGHSFQSRRPALRQRRSSLMASRRWMAYIVTLVAETDTAIEVTPSEGRDGTGIKSSKLN
jgi:hypothetical protein